MTFHEKTTTLVNFRGAIKAAMVEDITLKVDYTLGDSCQFWEDVRQIPGSPTGATIWFESGSYAYWDRYGRYWDFIVVPEIPEALR